MNQLAQINIRNTGETISGFAEVSAFLDKQGVLYEHWDTNQLPSHLQDKFNLSDADKEEILSSFNGDITRLAGARGYVKWDVIALSDSTPDLDALLKKFEQVHTHTEDEVRAIAAGSGIFVIKGSDDVGYFDVVLEAGDVISVPENNPHFFTLTSERKVVAVRLFIDPSGWVAHQFADPAFS